jgi:hypothetical protein
MPTRKQLLRGRILGYLGDAYGPADEEPIRLYVELDHQLQRVLRELDAAPELMIDHTNKIGATNAVKHPLLAEVPRLTLAMNQTWKSLGLTAAQRKKLQAPGGDDDDDIEV